MGNLAPGKKSGGWGSFRPAVVLVLAWVVAGSHGSRPYELALRFLDKFLSRVFSGFPATQEYVSDLLFHANMRLGEAYSHALGWATLLVPVGFLARFLARALVRGGGRDPLDRARAWTAARPRWATALLALPGSLLALRIFAQDFLGHPDHSATAVPLLTVVMTAIFIGSRSGLRSLLAPTVDPDEEARIAIGSDEIAFDAVAVTRETRAAVAGLAGLSVVMVAWIAALPIATLFRDPRLFAAVGVYVALALGGAAVFRLASRVAVGVDGVLVKGSSRTRFFAYRDLDDARLSWTDLELVRKGRVVLRLQLHGADAVRRDAVLARIKENIGRVQQGNDAMAAQLVASSTREQLARVASGRADYRAASLSREALWSLIEGPSVDGASRTAAAEALAKTSDGAERARLRVASAHCADPKVRVALEELAEGVDPGLAEGTRDARPLATRA
jgi:hypothetical protein